MCHFGAFLVTVPVVNLPSFFRMIPGRCVHQFVEPLGVAVFGEPIPPIGLLLPSCGLLAIQVLVPRQSEFLASQHIQN